MNPFFLREKPSGDEVGQDRMLPLGESRFSTMYASDILLAFHPLSRKASSPRLSRGVRDCSLFMPKGGRWFSSNSDIWKIYPSPEVGILKNYPPPPVYVTGPKCNPLPPPPSPQDATCLRLRNCVQHVFFCKGEESLSALCFVKNYLCSMMMRLSPVLKDLI